MSRIEGIKEKALHKDIFASFGPTKVEILESDFDYLLAKIERYEAVLKKLDSKDRQQERDYIYNDPIAALAVIEAYRKEAREALKEEAEK